MRPRASQPREPRLSLSRAPPPRGGPPPPRRAVPHAKIAAAIYVYRVGVEVGAGGGVRLLGRAYHWRYFDRGARITETARERAIFS